MSKYEPLHDYLYEVGHEAIPMGFSEIEHVLGFELPPSSRTQRAWWSNNPSNNVMTRAWLEAGYETANVDMAAGKLIFKRVRKQPMKAATPKSAPVLSGQGAAKVHPLWGAMKGLLTLPAGLDLTQPADPNLADFLDKKYGPERE